MLLERGFLAYDQKKEKEGGEAENDAVVGTRRTQKCMD